MYAIPFSLTKFGVLWTIFGDIKYITLTLNFDLPYHQYVRPNCFVKLFDITSPDHGPVNLLCAGLLKSLIANGYLA